MDSSFRVYHVVFGNVAGFPDGFSSLPSPLLGAYRSSYGYTTLLSLSVHLASYTLSRTTDPSRPHGKAFGVLDRVKVPFIIP